MIYIFFLHFVGDFTFQGKSTNFKAILLHVFIYTSVLFLGLLLALGTKNFDTIVGFCSVNFFIHLGIDYVTSQMSAYASSVRNLQLFYLVLGFDQFLHAATLLLTAGKLA